MDDQWVTFKSTLAMMIRNVDEMRLPDVEEPEDAPPRPIPENYGTW